MDKFVYSMLLIGTGAGVGLGVVVGVMHVKLARAEIDGSYHRANAITKFGIAITQGVLVYALAENGTARVSPLSFLYLIGLVVVTVGLSMQAGSIIQETAKAEIRGETEKK